jgi:hypothetical protein
VENKDEIHRFNAKPRFHILFVVGRHNILKNNIRYLNEQGNFVQVPFTLSTSELSVTIDQKHMSQPTELFKHPFVAKVMGTGFDKPANVSHFTLRFPRVQKVHLDRTIDETVSFAELQEIAQAADTTPQRDHEDRVIRGSGIPPSLDSASPSLSTRSTSADTYQSAIDTVTASPAPSLGEQMRAEGLVMIEEPETTPVKPEEQRTKLDSNKALIVPNWQAEVADSITL